MRTEELKLRKALADILEKAKVHRDLADDDYEQARWDAIVGVAYNALDRPTMADIGRIRNISS